MFQDVKLGTHKIGTCAYAINKCAFLLGFYVEMPQRSDPLLEKNHQKVRCGHKRGSSVASYPGRPLTLSTLYPKKLSERKAW